MVADQAAAEADRDRMGARTGLKLGQKVTHVALDGLLGQEEALADLAIDQSVGHELQNLDLAHRRLLLELTERRGEGMTSAVPFDRRSAAASKRRLWSM